MNDFGAESSLLSISWMVCALNDSFYTSFSWFFIAMILQTIKLSEFSLEIFRIWNFLSLMNGLGTEWLFLHIFQLVFHCYESSNNQTVWILPWNIYIYFYLLRIAAAYLGTLPAININEHIEIYFKLYSANLHLQDKQKNCKDFLMLLSYGPI